MCALLVGLPDVTVIGVGEWPSGLRIVIETSSHLCRVAVCRHIVTGFARWSWSICRCSAVRPGWCGASNVALPVVPAGLDGAGPEDRFFPLCDHHPCGPVGD